MPTMPAAVPAAAAPAQAAAKAVVEDIYGFLRVLDDGTVLRSPEGPEFCPATFPRSHPSVEWKEAVYDEAKNLRVRMYRPVVSSPPPPSSAAKLPVLVHFHCGGFCLGSCAWANVHAFCLRLAAEAGAVVLSAGYRLAPEHRLPAAFDDGAAFMRWLRGQSVPDGGAAARDPSWSWLAEAADFRRVFVTGDSAGGAIAHHLAVRLAGGELELAPGVAVRGYVLLMPFFGGARRTRSEAECPAEALLNLDMFDRFWRLALPHGATRDHPFANPFGPHSPDLRPVDFRRVLVVAGGLDMMRDRVADYARRLAAMGKPVELVEFAGEQHGFYTLDPGSDATSELIGVVRRFVHGGAAESA